MTAPASTPSRDDSGTTSLQDLKGAHPCLTCPVCAAPFTATGRQRYCSTACRKSAFRRRRTAAATHILVPPRSTRRDQTVFECGSCGTRQLGQQRCPDCGTFGNSLGLGGACPCCDEPVTLTDLDFTT